MQNGETEKKMKNGREIFLILWLVLKKIDMRFSYTYTNKRKLKISLRSLLALSGYSLDERKKKGYIFVISYTFQGAKIMEIITKAIDVY